MNKMLPIEEIKKRLISIGFFYGKKRGVTNGKEDRFFSEKNYDIVEEARNKKAEEK